MQLIAKKALAILIAKENQGRWTEEGIPMGYICQTDHYFSKYTFIAENNYTLEQVLRKIVEFPSLVISKVCWGKNQT